MGTTSRTRQLLVALGVVAVLVAAWFVGGLGRGGTATAADDAAGQRTVTVVGHGSSSAVPDQVEFQVDLTSRGDTLGAAMDTASSTADAVQRALEGAGIAAKDTQTQDLSVYPQYRREKGKTPVPDGYRVHRSTRVLARDLGKASDAIAAALQAGGRAARVDGIRLIVGDPAKAQGEARDDAVTDAKGKAERYASALGLSLGTAQSVKESATEQPLPYREYLTSAQDSGAAIQPGRSEVSADVTVVWSLE